MYALAVLAASGASFAQSSVSVYGIADIWFGSTSGSVKVDGVDQNAVPTKTVLQSGGVNGSRFGFKGTEDLGGGLKANFNLEQGFTIDDGAQATAGVAFSRQAWVGVSGGFGAVKLGLSGTAYDDILGTNNNTFDSALTARPWVGYTGVAKNQIHYAAPTMGGFTGAVSYALGEDKKDAAGAVPAIDAGSVFALNVQYAAGPLMVGFAHQKEDSGSTATGLGVLTPLNKALLDAQTGLVVAVNANSTAEYNLITGSYDLGVAKLLASYNQTKLNFKEAGLGEISLKEFQLGANIPLSKSMTLAVGYGESKASETVDIYGAKAYSAAVAYSLSKRTMVYAGFNSTKVTFDAAVANAEISANVYALGLNHSF